MNWGARGRVIHNGRETDGMEGHEFCRTAYGGWVDVKIHHRTH